MESSRLRNNSSYFAANSSWKSINASDNYEFQFKYYLDFEEKFDSSGFVRSMRREWHHSIPIAALYILLIYLAKKIMETRPKYELKVPLVLWNFSLAAFSIYGAVFRFIPELYYCVHEHSFKYSVCDNTAKDSGVGMFWIYLFTMSKVVELGDTAFIVLRKQKLIFLHWYHHITVLVNVWFSIAQTNASGRWFITVNITVHSIMYTYFFFKALKYKIPKAVSVFVTSLQLVQMLIGCYINYTCYKAIRSGETCVATMENILFSLGIYFSYLLLFGSFFWKAYISGPDVKTSDIKPVSNQTTKKVN